MGKIQSAYKVKTYSQSLEDLEKRLSDMQKVQRKELIRFTMDYINGHVGDD